MTNLTTSASDSAAVARLQYFVWGVGCFVVASAGTVANLLSILVLSHRSMRKSSTSVYLIAQAIYDTLVLLSVLFFFSLPALFSEWQVYYSYFHAWAYPIALTAQSGSIWITVAFTVERYIVCCHPLNAQTKCSPKRARRVVLLVSLAVIIYNLPRTLEYYSYRTTDPTTNRTVVLYNETALVQNPYYQQIYLAYMYVIVMFIVPLVILIVPSICLILAVKRSQSIRRQMNAMRPHSDSEHNISIMVISVVVVFLVCQITAAVDNVVNIFVQDKGPLTLKFQVISTLMVTFNSAANFLCYCMFGRKFRKVMLLTCMCSKTQPRSWMGRSISVKSKATSIRSANAAPKSYSPTKKSLMFV